MNKAIFAGTFDPFTIGHYELVKRACELFDEVIVAVSVATNKKCVADCNQRLEIAKESVADLKNVSAVLFDGFLTDFAKENGCKYIIRGLRNSIDFEYEKNLYAQYKAICSDIEVFYLICDAKIEFISSSFIKEVVKLGGDYTPYLCENAKRLVTEVYESALVKN